MPELNTEAETENLLMSVVMGSDEQDLDARDPNTLDNGQDVDQREAEAVEGEEKPKAEAKQAEQAKQEEAPEEDEIELEGEEGQEPVRLKLKDVVAEYQEYQQFKAQKDEIVAQVEREAVERQREGFTRVQQAGRQMAAMVDAALRMLAPPQPPNADAMLNPSSPQYDPDGYHRAFANYQRMSQQYQQAQGLGQQLLQQAQEAQAQQEEARDARELEKLNRAWPEFTKPETVEKFVSDMGKAYGFTREELDAVLIDHRQAIVARDALAYRAMKAQSGNVKAKVEAKAPKLVRSKQEAKGGGAQRDRAANGQFTSGALADLRKTNSDDAAVRLFAGLVRDKRI
jgi:hypothetical protein